MAPRKDSWRHNEDAILCQIWINVGGDACTGVSQSLDTLWERICVEYNAQRRAGCIERSRISCKFRWKAISPACMKWRQAINNAKASHRSGENKEDELMKVKLAYYDKNGVDFTFGHCWRYLKNTVKFGETPSMENINTPILSTINLEDDESPANEPVESTTRQARPQGQKAAKLAKKKSKQQDVDSLRDQMQKAYEQSEREYQQRQEQWEENKRIEQRAEDARTMKVDPLEFTPRKRRYWEKKQQEIIEKEEGTSSIPTHPQDRARTENDNIILVDYVPVQETQWIL